MQDTKLIEISGCTSVAACLTGWAVATLPIIEWLSYFVGFIAGLLTIASWIHRKFFKNKGQD